MDSIFSITSLFTAYTSVITIVSLFQQFYDKSVPESVRNYINSKIEQWFMKPSPNKESFTLIVDQYENDMGCYNILYKACELYISDKLRSSATRLTGSYINLNEPVSYRITQGEEYVETLEKDGIKFLWKFIGRNPKTEEDYYTGQSKSFELCFDLAYKNDVLDGHLPLVVVKYYEDMMKLKKDIHLFTLEGRACEWKSVKFNHPFTFDALALDVEIREGFLSSKNNITRAQFLVTSSCSLLHHHKYLDRRI